MKNRKLSPLIWITLCLLFVAQAGCSSAQPATTGAVTSSAATEASNFMVQPETYRNIQQLNLQLDWVRRPDSPFPIRETSDNFTAVYTFHGIHYTLDEYFARSAVLGFLVLQDDQIVLERYFRGAGPKSRFISNSMGKSIVSVLTGIAVEKGEIKSVDDPVTRYLPSLSESGFSEVTVKQTLQMATGVDWNEDYTDPDSDFSRFVLAWWRGTPALIDFAAACKPVEPPGRRFEYQSIDTQVLGRLLETVSGRPLNEYCERELWQKIGAEDDAFYYRGKQQHDILAAAGFCATLRDYGRFGLMMMNGGKLGGHQIVSEDWVRMSTTAEGASLLVHPTVGNACSDSLGYAYQWWLLDGGIYMAMGIHGQAIYIDPARRIVIVQTSAWQEPDPDERWDEMITVMTVIADELGPSQRYTQRIWDENYPFYRKILNLPFNQELLSGELDEAIFRDYIIQDYHFCQNYKKAHAILLAKAPDEKAAKAMLDYMNMIDAEIESLHATYIKKYGITEKELTGPTEYPSTELYNSYLIKTATLEPFEVGFMATLPCHWVYYQIGSDMKKMEKVQGNKYQAWIDEYGDTTWEQSDTKEVVDLAEEYMQAANDETRLKMKDAFVTAMKLEYMFWDGIYNRVKWVQQ
ncbi:MAG: serine hydrolase [Dehalococcoidia bacterium]|nr:serine hydrolase [Dehalococcoidia bacterium]